MNRLDLRNRIKAVEFDPEALYDALDAEEQRGRDQLLYLVRYLEGGKAEGDGHPCTTMLVEHVYYCSAYRAEYSSFYAHCFIPYPPFARRIHFFRKLQPDQLETLFEKALLQDGEAIGEIQREYLGFVVGRPVSSIRVGMTALRPYPESNHKRRYVTRRQHVNIAGVYLSVEVAPFMQQDQTIAGCASVAVWCALAALPRSVMGRSPTTAQVAESATRQTTGGRDFPASTSGLDIYQLCDAIRQTGWTPERIDMMPKDMTGAMVRSYLKSRFPVIVGGRSTADDSLGHAMTVVGYAEGECESFVQKLDGVRMEMKSAKKVYVHDDRNGPYFRASLVEAGRNQEEETNLILRGVLAKEQRNVLKLLYKNEWVENWGIVYLVSPVHSAITVSLLELYHLSFGAAKSLHEEMKGSRQMLPLQLDAYFQDSQTYLRGLAGAVTTSTLAGTSLAPFLRDVSLPRYIGVTDVATTSGTPLYSLLWDTTDIGRSRNPTMDHLLAVVPFGNWAREGFSDFLPPVAPPAAPFLAFAQQDLEDVEDAPCDRSE